MRCSRRGFSLLELVLVLTVIGVLSGLAGVRMAKAGASQSVKLRARVVADQWQRLQERAMMTGRPQRLEVALETGVLTVSQWDGVAWTVPGDHLDRRINLQEDGARLSFFWQDASEETSAASESHVWYFWADGRVEPSGTLRMTDGRYESQLSLVGPGQALETTHGRVAP